MSVAETISERTARAARVILREWIIERIDGEDEITVETLVADAYSRFAQDEEFAEAILADGLAILIPTLAHEVWARSRSFVETASGAVSRSALEERSASRFSRWMEYVGEGRHKSLLAMTKGDLQTAIENRKAQVRGELRTIAFLSEIDKRLAANQTVGAKFKETDLDRIWRQKFRGETQPD